MSKKTHLYVLWTNDNPITAEKMVFMYTVNSLIKGWVDKAKFQPPGFMGAIPGMSAVATWMM